MAESRNILTGITETIPDKAVAISMERYDELIRKETLLDSLMENRKLSIYLYQEVEEGSNA